MHSFIQDNVEEGSEVFTDDFKSYEKLANYEHGTVKHSVGEYVNEQIHINGMESFWSMLKRAHKGTFHQISPKHLQRYVDEFAGPTQYSRTGYNHSDEQHGRRHDWQAADVQEFDFR